MPTVIPYVPRTITVHLGAPASDAANVTVLFTDYVKNVASSEIYPTWNESALRANILAIVSFALNRVYTEFYRSRGYPFDITSSTAYDQNFVNGRNFFSSISTIVDDIFNSYLRKQGFVEPLAAKFCNGTTVTCAGLSQWGSEYLARQGYTSVQIIRNYYGEDTEIVANAPVRNYAPSYPGTPVRRGDRGANVTVVQVSLNRIAQNYPAIPKVNPVDGIFGAQTETSVRKFQQIFGLDVDGIVGRATWYQLVQLYVGVTQLAELRSLGQRFYNISWEYPDPIEVGDRGEKVEHLQYMLSVLSEFISEVPPVKVDGIFGEETRQAVLGFQRFIGIPQTGSVGDLTWDEIYDQFAGIENTVFANGNVFPPILPTEPARNLRAAQTQMQALADSNPNNSMQNQPAMLRALQQSNGLAETGTLNTETAQALATAVHSLQYTDTSRMMQFPGYDLEQGSQDDDRRRL